MSFLSLEALKLSKYHTLSTHSEEVEKAYRKGWGADQLHKLNSELETSSGKTCYQRSFSSSSARMLPCVRTAITFFVPLRVQEKEDPEPSLYDRAVKYLRIYGVKRA